MPNTWSDEAPQQRERRLAMPELGEPRCPNGHDSSIPPRCPALMFATCHHYTTDATWNEYCITCGVRQSRHPRATFTCWNTGTLFRAPS
jgi:hypothetical protein